MKQSIFFLVVCAIIVASCDKGSASGGGVDPNPPTPITVAAKINSASIAVPASGTILLDGSGNGTKAVINISVSGSPIPALTADGSSSGFVGNQYTSVDLFESKEINFAASNVAGSDSKKVNIPVTLHPEFAKLVGTQIAGKRWKFVSFLRRPVGSTGVFTELITPCQKTYVYTFNRDTTSRVDRGTCAGGGSTSSVFTFNVNTKEIWDNLSHSTQLQIVSFNSTATIMEFYSEFNGYTYRRVYHEE